MVVHLSAVVVRYGIVSRRTARARIDGESRRCSCRQTDLTATPTSDAGLPSLTTPPAAATVDWLACQTRTGQRSVYICNQGTIIRQDDLIMLIRVENWRLECGNIRQRTATSAARHPTATMNSAKPPKHDKKLAKLNDPVKLLLSCVQQIAYCMVNLQTTKC